MTKQFIFGVVISLALLLYGGTLARAQQPSPRTVRFSGYEWEIRQAGKGGPGPNQWSPANVRVDTKGRLHLQITRVYGKPGTPPEWHCAELYTRESFGLGTYQFQVTGRIDQLDRNVVLGLFDYPSSETDPDGTNEIDIEFAHWGNPQWDGGNYTVYPAILSAGKSQSHTFPLVGANITTHRFTREEGRITFQSFLGTLKSVGKPIAQWAYAPTNSQLLPQKPLPIHINLWLFEGKAPVNGEEVEIVIDRFTFTPKSAR